MNRETEAFLVRAKQAGYAEIPHSRSFADGRFLYTCSCFGTEQLAGQEVLRQDGNPVWAVNWLGRVLAGEFPEEFFTEAARAGCVRFPYRGPERYEKGGLLYRCSVKGDADWFYGYEEILRDGSPVWECAFHGGEIR